VNLGIKLLIVYSNQSIEIRKVLENRFSVYKIARSIPMQIRQIYVGVTGAYEFVPLFQG
jgi:hypothetical protein